MKRIPDFARYKRENRPISMVTSYDAWSARLVADSPIDAILVGDSAAMVMHGERSTVSATVEQMATHVSAVRRGAPEALLVADMPFLSFRKGIPAAMEAVEALVRAGANAVKVEGAEGHLDVVRHIVESGVPVMGHLGLIPQSINALGGHRVQGRTDAGATRLREQAKALEAAGVFSVVLECIPEGIARSITEALTVPTIGIGCGPGTSGQILVLQDLLGLTPGFSPVFVRKYLNGAALIGEALSAFDQDVKQGAYPTLDESYLR